MIPEIYPLLKEVSRSFYLTVRILPGAIRFQVALAYLMARASDTIADTTAIPESDRLESLRRLREAILQDAPPPEITLLKESTAHPGERRLLHHLPQLLEMLRGLAAADRQRVQEVLRTIISGQEKDLLRFSESAEFRVRALATDEELEDYIYRVAGCVGEFWTRMCRAHLFPAARLNEVEFLDRGIQFGKGLQLVNVLRDLPRDLKMGRCYLPSEGLLKAGLTPQDLLDPSKEAQVRPLFGEYFNRAGRYLESGWIYTLMVPWSCGRVRLGCAWPVLLGVRTLSRLKSGPILDSDRAAKVPRSEFRGLIWRTLLLYPFESQWKRLFEREGFSPIDLIEKTK